MSPSDLLLAKQECSQLLQQGLIEPTDSDWACQAFYVEKRSELVRGKKWLVIDYQPLNSFLKDDKFPFQKSKPCLSIFKGHVFSLSLILKPVFGNLVFHQLTVPKLLSVFLMLTINGLLWQKFSILSSIMLWFTSMISYYFHLIMIAINNFF